MLHFIFGEPGSKKSLYAEELISSYAGSVVYIGTLPKHYHYKLTIQSHKNRRPSNWSLIELTGEPEIDINLTSIAIEKYKNILFDGLVFYIVRLISIFNEDFSVVRPKMISLIGKAAQSTNKVIIVDSPVPQQLCKKHQIVLRDAHSIIVRQACSITFVEEGIAKEIKPKDVLYMDRVGSIYYDSRIDKM